MRAQREALGAAGPFCKIVLISIFGENSEMIEQANQDGGQAERSTRDARNEHIVATMREKSLMKMQVYDNTFETFNEMKDILHELVNDLNPHLEHLDRRVRLEYRDRGKFEAEVRLAGDVLLVSMHTNVFEFDRSHSIWHLAYVQQDKLNSYCGTINMYNFLADSFKYNRADDLGYLVGRLFINRDKHYFVEGKRQSDYLCSNFGQTTIDRQALTHIMQTALQYTLDFDLLTPPYDMVKIVTVAQMNSKLESSWLQTGKRLGFQYNSDDVKE